MCQTRNNAFARSNAGLRRAEATPIERILPCGAPILRVGIYQSGNIYRTSTLRTDAPLMSRSVSTGWRKALRSPGGTSLTVMLMLDTLMLLTSNREIWICAPLTGASDGLNNVPDTMRAPPGNREYLTSSTWTCVASCSVLSD